MEKTMRIKKFWTKLGGLRHVGRIVIVNGNIEQGKSLFC